MMPTTPLPRIAYCAPGTAPKLPAEIVRRYVAACTEVDALDDAAVEAFRRAESDLIDATAKATGIDTASLATYGAFTPEAGTLRLRGQGDCEVLRIHADGAIAWLETVKPAPHAANPPA